MKNTVKVRFKEGGQTYDFSNEIEGLEVGDILAVKSGPEDRLSAVEVVSIHRKFHDWNKPTLFQFDISEIENLDLQFSLKQLSVNVILSKDFDSISNLEICQYLIENGKNILVKTRGVWKDEDDLSGNDFYLLGLNEDKVEIVREFSDYSEVEFDYFSEKLGFDEFFIESWRGGVKSLVRQDKPFKLPKKLTLKFQKILYPEIECSIKRMGIIKDNIKSLILNHVKNKIESKNDLRFFWKNERGCHELNLREYEDYDEFEPSWEIKEVLKDDINSTKLENTSYIELLLLENKKINIEEDTLGLVSESLVSKGDFWFLIDIIDFDKDYLINIYTDKCNGYERGLFYSDYDEYW